MNEIEKRYKVEEDFDGILRMHEAVGTVRGKTVKLHQYSLLWWSCRSVIDKEKWDRAPKTPNEAQTSFINECYTRIESCKNEISDYQKLIDKALKMSLELAPKRERL